MRKEWLLFISSVLLYYFAPDYYSWPYCAVCCLVFIIGALCVVLPEIKRGVYLSFNIIFLFGYFWTSFAYPVLVYGSLADRDNLINKALNWDLLSHTSALALLFIIAYILGFTYYGKKQNAKEGRIPRLRPPYLLYSMSLVAYLGVGIWGYIQTRSANMIVGQFLIDIYFVLFSICLFVNTNNSSSKYPHKLKYFFRINHFFIISGAFVFLTFIVLGDRMPAIKTILTIVAVYYLFWERIKVRHILSLGLLLLLLLFFVRQTRGSDTNLASGNVSRSTVEGVFSGENGPLFVFADLFFINRELCLGYEYSQTHELYHPERILIAPLSPIPLLPSTVSKLLWGIEPSKMETGARLNDVLDSDFDIEGHLGNHPASDSLMSFGLIGMLLIAYLLGRSIGFIQKNIYSSFYMGVCYLVLMEWSLYLARATALTLIRPVGYVFLFGYLIYRIPIQKKNK